MGVMESASSQGGFAGAPSARLDEMAHRRPDQQTRSCSFFAKFPKVAAVRRPTQEVQTLLRTTLLSAGESRRGSKTRGTNGKRRVRARFIDPALLGTVTSSRSKGLFSALSRSRSACASTPCDQSNAIHPTLACQDLSEPGRRRRHPRRRSHPEPGWRRR